MTQLQVFIASLNNLTLKVSKNWIPPFQAIFMDMRSWNIGPQFPMWLETQKQVIDVDISDGGIQGEVPTWFWNLCSQIQLLNISHNQFVGEVPVISMPSWSSRGGGPWYMYLGSNNFSGSIPQISTIITELDLSNNFFSKGLSSFLCDAKNESYKLEVLNLRGNDLSGEIHDCWMNWPELKVLVLRENSLVGTIPKSIDSLVHLKSLDLQKNRLTGPLPSSLGNCTGLLKVDVSDNQFEGNLPTWLGMRLSRLKILSLRSNKFHGELPQQLCQLKHLQILDLANNTFIGFIPKCISNFSAMIIGEKIMGADAPELNYGFFPFEFIIESATVTTKGNTYQYDTMLALLTSMDLSSNNFSGDIPAGLTRLVGLRYLNFSRNHLSGKIPNGIGDMKVLESVDLSENQLSGEIPQSFSRLSALSFLNLSYNNLSGNIPVSTQLQSFSPSSFRGNKLCGLPLMVHCSSGDHFPNIENENENDNEDEVDWFYISMAIGFSLAFWGVSASLIFKRSWRHAFYQFVDYQWESMREKLHI